MAMVVKNNMSAVRTLNTLNQNSSALQKSLAKVSSGMKINSAQDDASGYAISERMRVQIRSLDQANQNTQNGSSLMKTAEGAVSSTVEILKSLKEKAINAANDTNKDSDRATIQKEIDQFIDQIDDNALTTFNGKYLVDGSKSQKGSATFTAMTNQSLATDTTATTALTNLKNRNNESLEISATDSITVSYVRNGKTQTTTFKVADQNLGNIFDKAESIESDTVFAGATNKSVAGTGVTLKDGVEPSISETTGVGSADATSGTSNSSGSYSLDELKSALAAATSKMDAAKSTLEEKNAAAGNFVWDSTTAKTKTDTDLTYGAAGDLANAIQAAGAIKMDGTAQAAASGGYAGDALKVVTTQDAASSFSIGNLEAGTAITTAWNGRNLDSLANSKAHIEDAISRMTASTNTAVAEAGENLKTAYTNYNLAMSELNDAQDAYDTAAKDVEVLTNAVNAIEAAAEANAMTDTMVTDMTTVLNALAHPGNSGTSKAATGALANDAWVGTKIQSDATTDAYDTQTTPTHAYKYTNDTDAIDKIAKGIVADIVSNVDIVAATGTSLTSAQTGAYTEMKDSLKNIASKASKDDGSYDGLGTAFTADNYTGANVKLNGTDVFHPDASTGIDGTIFQDYANKAGEAAYAKAQTDANTLSGALTQAMGRNSSSGGGSTIGILTGSYVGANAAGDAVYTADGTNGITVTANKEGVGGQISGLTISVTDSEGNVKKAANASLDDFRTTIFAKNESDANELSFQVGANANQAIAVGLEDMRSEALGLKSSDGTKVSVATQERANAAVAVFDNAINKALDQQTTIGSIEARLEYTSSNLTTSSENVQAAESTIRDADMAKEMTNYTKNNVLLQAAQSMLAQANQSSSAVLSLLQ